MIVTVCLVIDAICVYVFIKGHFVHKIRMRYIDECATLGQLQAFDGSWNSSLKQIFDLTKWTYSDYYPDKQP